METWDRLTASLEATYDFHEVLGGGGMSRVFRATERSLGRVVVLKTLAPELLSESSAERFQREIVVAARLQHPHLVPLLTAGSAG